MPVAGGGFEQCYNAQAVVAADSLLVVATDVVQAPNDKQQLVSMAARNSPESSGRNSPLRSELVTAKPPRRSDIGKAIEVETDDLLKRLGSCAVAQTFGQGVGPSGILGL
jgi:hypothetical protein